jgi:hypothetical protein
MQRTTVPLILLHWSGLLHILRVILDECISSIKETQDENKAFKDTTHSCLIQAVQLTTEPHDKASLMALHFHTSYLYIYYVTFCVLEAMLETPPSILRHASFQTN